MLSPNVNVPSVSSTAEIIAITALLMPDNANAMQTIARVHRCACYMNVRVCMCPLWYCPTSAVIISR